jgi:hypothetical protein
MIDEVKLRKKKDEEINYMLSKPLRKAWTIFEPMLAHVIQLLQCRLLTRCSVCFIKLHFGGSFLTVLPLRNDHLSFLNG